MIDAAPRPVEAEVGRLARGRLDGAFRGRADALDLAGGQQVRLAAAAGEGGEFQRGRARVEGEDTESKCVTPPPWRPSLLASARPSRRQYPCAAQREETSRARSLSARLVADWRFHPERQCRRFRPRDEARRQTHCRGRGQQSEACRGAMRTTIRARLIRASRMLS